jgi:galactokinase
VRPRSAAAARGLRLAVGGNLPSRAGLSSSSALVCAAALARLAAAGPAHAALPSRAHLAAACARAERHVGTLGGGMDHAAVLLARAGEALHVRFRPRLRAAPCRLPRWSSPP